VRPSPPPADAIKTSTGQNVLVVTLIASERCCDTRYEGADPPLFLIAVSRNWNTCGDALALRSAMSIAWAIK